MGLSEGRNPGTAGYPVVFLKTLAVPGTRTLTAAGGLDSTGATGVKQLPSVLWKRVREEEDLESGLAS